MSLAAADLGTILSVWAHPDDETYLCGGLMARAVRNGSRVVCVTATRGELGSPDEARWPSGQPLAAVRTKEMDAALAVLGVTEHHWLDYPDGGCADVDQAEAVRRVTELMADVRPDTV
ncbi:MAG: mycothiol S-conjugate amidase, partial [Pseudonocardiales bacterium]|nr:mycothiol S-conjugate amidase [Pseudonocardiales bacterium]